MIDTNDPNYERNLLAELQGTECACGKRKQPMQTFCRSCYFSLPASERKALYNRFGEGYEEAYEAAAETLAGED